MAWKDKLYPVPVVGTALRVQDRYKDDAADQLAASIGFFGFLSLFPIMILALSIAGFVLQGDEDAQQELVSAITGAIPGFEATLGDGNCSRDAATGRTTGGGQGEEACTAVGEVVESVKENAGLIFGVGLVTLLLSALRVVNAAMVATSRVFRITMPTGVMLRVRQLGAMALVGSLALIGAIASGAVAADAEGALGVLLGVGAVALSLLLDIALFAVAYRILAAGEGPSWRTILPGAVLAGVGWTILKIFGSTYVAGQVAQANALYGTLGGVIGLLLLLYLSGRLYLYGAELSALLATPADDAGRDAPDDASPKEEPMPPEETTEVPRDRTPPTGSVRVLPRPGADEASPAVSEETRDRVLAREAARDKGTPVREALAFAIAIGIVGGMVAAWKPWED